MEWSRAFTELILDFAARVAAVDGISLDKALLTVTPLYPNFKLGTAFEASQPVWQEYLVGFHDAADPVAWAHAFYIAHARQYHPHPFGCFEYHYDPETRTAGLSALSRERRPERIRELRALFTDLRWRHPEAATVQGESYPMRGTSRLYNLPAYRALFPPEYVATFTPVRSGFTFLDGHWDVRPEPAQSFRNRHSHSGPGSTVPRIIPIWKPAFPSGRSAFGGRYTFITTSTATSEVLRLSDILRRWRNGRGRQWPRCIPGRATMMTIPPSPLPTWRSGSTVG